jgi:general stress protein 26
MDKQVLDFADKHRISVLTTIVDGKPHSATMHYANATDPFYFVFLTERASRKCAHMQEGEKYPAAMVVGFSEEEWVTLQMEGEVEIVTEQEQEEPWRIYSHKYRGSEKYKNNREDLLLKFTPTWWRYTQVRPKPPVVISSE